MRLTLVWIVSLVLAAVMGYQYGLMQVSQTEVSVYDTSPPSGSVENTSSATDVSASVADTTPVQNNVASTASDDQYFNREIEIIDSTDDLTGLAKTGLELSSEVNHSKAHLRESKEFEENFDHNDSDWQAQTNFTDFLQLHDDAPLIDLQKIICSQAQCQLIGQFDGEHEGWENILEQMRGQAWWDYTGTSSSTTSRDGVTYFNVFVNKKK